MTPYQSLSHNVASTSMTLREPLSDGKIEGPNDGEAIIDIPEDLLIKEAFDPIAAIC